MKVTKTEQSILDKFSIYVQRHDVSNEFLVQLIELGGSFLNMQTISDYAKEKGLSYNGVKKTRDIREIFNTKFVIDNE